MEGTIIKALLSTIALVGIIFGTVFPVLADEEKEISRHILRSIDFNSGTGTIEVHYLLIQQDQGKAPVINEDFVKKIYPEDTTGYSDKTINDEVMNNQSLYYDIFVNDEILGMDAYIYRDEREEKLDSSRIESLVKEVVEQNYKDFKQPPTEEQLNKHIVKKMKQDGLEAEEAESYSLINRFLMPLLFILAVAGVILAAAKQLKAKQK